MSDTTQRDQNAKNTQGNTITLGELFDKVDESKKILEERKRFSEMLDSLSTEEKIPSEAANTAPQPGSESATTPVEVAPASLTENAVPATQPIIPSDAPSVSVPSQEVVTPDASVSAPAQPTEPTQ